MRTDLTGPDRDALVALLYDRLLPAANGRGYENEIEEHLTHRLAAARDNIVPWLGQYLRWDAARVLEIGAGTGSSVVAFAEVCRHIDAIDILDGHLDVARERVERHGLRNVAFHCRNATEDLAAISPEPYDLIVFSAALEHMTYRERIAALQVAWAALSAAGVLAIYETPNRLWFFDGHTSLANFFHWLPDELAIDYAGRTKRAEFNAFPLSAEQLYRWGRGASFHELEIAIGLGNIELLDSMSEYLDRRSPGYLASLISPAGQRYRALLAEIAPEVAPAFTEELLNLALRRR